MTWGAIGGAAVATVGGALLSKGGSSQSGSQTQTTQQQLDPRLQAMLFGDGTSGNQGLLAQYQSYLNLPQGAGTAAYGQQAQDFLKNNSAGITGQLQSATGGLLGSHISAPQVQAAGAPTPDAIGAAAVQSASVNAPAQNNINLAGAYDKFINGNAGENPYLTNALQAGVNATNAGYTKNVNTLTDQLQRTVLPGIRSNAVLAGQYGGTRQGIAEGNALGDFTRQLNDNNAQLAATNSANTIGAQAQAFNQGQDRALAATQQLGAQQVAVAGQNAANQQQANTQYAGNQQQANVQNQNTQLSNFQFNAGNQQQANSQNAGLQAGANALNSNNQLGGIAGLSGLLAGQYGVAQNQDNYGINRAGQVNGLLAPYMGANSGSTTSTPLYSNTGANILGGATAGLGLYSGIRNSGLLSGFGNIFTGGSGLGASSMTPVSTGGYQMPDLSSALNFGSY